MTREEKQSLGKELIENTKLNKEQYAQLCKLIENLFLEIYTPEPTWEQIFESK